MLSDLQVSGPLGIDVSLSQPLGMGSQPLHSLQEELGVDMSSVQVGTARTGLCFTCNRVASSRSLICNLALRSNLMHL